MSSAQTLRAHINVQDVIERVPRVQVQHSKTASHVAQTTMTMRENVEVRAKDSNLKTFYITEYCSGQQRLTF